MSQRVQLYVYDLSKGLARAMSLPLTGKQIDGVWHTSCVVFGREIFYGQGILEAVPGTTHHGQPLQVIDMGETALDQETFNDYITEMRDHYRADKYHLLDFNCNTFTGDVIGFLTGGTIPAWISNLPAEFLATPFGAALRPQIDAMFSPQVTPPTPGTSTPVSTPRPPLPPIPDQAAASSLLADVVNRANLTPGVDTTRSRSTSQSSSVSSSSRSPQQLTSPLHIATSPASFSSLLASHKVVVAFFTSQSAACKSILPTFEKIAREKGSEQKGIGFVQVDVQVGLAGQIVEQFGVGQTPVFLFFTDTIKVDEVVASDATNASTLRTRIASLISQAFPPHPHQTLALPSVQAISTSPILYTQAPNYTALVSKLQTFLTQSSRFSTEDQTSVINFITHELVPFFESRNSSTTTSKATPEIETLINRWVQYTNLLFHSLGQDEIFPVIDLWRISVLDLRMSTWLTVQRRGTEIASALKSSGQALETPMESPSSPIDLILNSFTQIPIQQLPRPFVLTSIRLLANSFSTLPLSLQLLSATSRSVVTSVLVEVLLENDPSIRSAAAGLAFNIATVRHRKGKSTGAGAADAVQGEVNGDWELEVAIALVESIRKEVEKEDVVYRLTAALALILFLSPHHATALLPNLEALGARSILESKLRFVKKREAISLVNEVAARLC